MCEALVCLLDCPRSLERASYKPGSLSIVILYSNPLRLSRSPHLGGAPAWQCATRAEHGSRTAFRIRLLYAISS